MPNGNGICKHCGKPIAIYRNATHMCPIAENEYPQHFRELVGVCRALTASLQFVDWMEHHALNASVSISFLNNIRTIADVKIENCDHRFVNIVQNKDCVSDIEVE